MPREPMSPPTAELTRSYMADVFEHLQAAGGLSLPAAVVEALIRAAESVEYMPRRDRLVLTFNPSKPAPRPPVAVPAPPAECPRAARTRHQLHAAHGPTGYREPTLFDA